MNAKIDEKSLEQAKKIFETGEVYTFEIGTTRGLCDIHKKLFENLYDFAGQIRSKNISK